MRSRVWLQWPRRGAWAEQWLFSNMADSRAAIVAAKRRRTTVQNHKDFERLQDRKASLAWERQEAYIVHIMADMRVKPSLIWGVQAYIVAGERPADAFPRGVRTIN